VVIVGAGFGGLWAAKVLSKAPVRTTVVDRNNYHTFFPLLYQVAAAELGPEQIVNPVRSVTRRLRNASFVMATVERVDPDRQVLHCSDGREVPYDYLILAPGSVPHFFGIPGADQYAFPLRSLEQGVALRNHILQRFEEAAAEPDPDRRRRLLTLTIVGGGYTGVEFAGALAELVNGPLAKDFPMIEVENDVRLIVVEATNRLLPGMPDGVHEYTLERLGRLGVEVMLEAQVSRITADTLYLKDGEAVSTETVIWTAGHKGHPLGEASGFQTTPRGQITVLPTLQTPAYPNVYVIGDLAGVSAADGRLLPMVAQVAMQGGEAAARNVLRQAAGLAPIPFVYRDKGVLAVIGRNKAVARLGKRVFTGFFAWLLWLGVHLFNLIGFRNRLLVLVNWAWDYVWFERGTRLILPTEKAGAKVAAGGVTIRPRDVT
jgi:NADH dehydrogenase